MQALWYGQIIILKRDVLTQPLRSPQGQERLSQQVEPRRRALVVEPEPSSPTLASPPAKYAVILALRVVRARGKLAAVEPALDHAPAVAQTSTNYPLVSVALVAWCVACASLAKSMSAVVQQDPHAR